MSIRSRSERVVSERRVAYKHVFNSGENAKTVLEDLSRFCRANESCFHEDPRVHAVLEGRREVWLRIQQHIGLSDAELWRLFGATRLRTEDDERRE